MRPWSKEWLDDCEIFVGRILEGRYRHWCTDCVGRPIDETMTQFFEFCKCFKCQCGEFMYGHYMGDGPLHMFDDYYRCPKLRFWNFWKHDQWNTDLNGDRV
jgi:hypothetical protein